MRRGARLVELDVLRVAPAAVAALGDEHAHTRRRQIGELVELALGRLLVDDRADRHLQLDVGAAAAGALRAFAVGAAAGLEDFLETEVEEGVEVGGGDDVDRAAVPAIAAVGTAARDEFLPAETHGAGPAVTRGHVDVYFVDKQISLQSSVDGRQSVSR